MKYNKWMKKKKEKEFATIKLIVKPSTALFMKFRMGDPCVKISFSCGASEVITIKEFFLHYIYMKLKTKQYPPWIYMTLYKCILVKAKVIRYIPLETAAIFS